MLQHAAILYHFANLLKLRQQFYHLIFILLLLLLLLHIPTERAGFFSEQKHNSTHEMGVAHGFQSRPAASRRAVNSKFHTLTGFATLWRITLTGKMLPLSSLQDVSPTIVFEHMQTSYGIHSVDCQT